MSGDYHEIRVTHEGPVAVIALAREDRLNAYTPDMGEELVQALRAAAADETVRAVVLTGAGRAFCAGADRECLRGATGRSGKRLGEEHFIAGFTQELATLPLLTIAAINGAAAGIGVTATLAFDIRLVAEDAPLVLNFAELGIMPGLGSTHFLPRLVGEARARELLLCTRRLDGRQAAAIGLASEALPVQALMPRALELAAQVAACPRAAVAAIKQGLVHGGGATLAEALAEERRLAAALNAARR